ncbi:MAG: ABC transporter permease [Bacteroidetes bacterium]|nr:ABC transporter permease [Bacteroidota bacterium]
MGKIGLIVRREFWTRVRKPSFLIMTILGPLLLVGGITAVVFLGMQESGIQNVVIIDKAHLLTNKLKDTDDIKFFYQPEDMPDSVFKAGPYTAMIDVNEAVLENNTVQLFYKDLPSQTVQNYLSSEIEKVIEKEKLRVNNVDPETYQRIKTALKVQLFDIDKAGKRSYDQAKAGIGFAFGYLIFLFIFLYGVQVMRGVMEEKQNRVVEVLISSVKPFQLMMGKIVGIALVGLTQFLLWVALSAVLGTIGLGLAKDRISASALQQATPQMTTQLQAQLGGAELAQAQDDRAEDLQVLVDIWNDLPIALIIGLFIFYFLGGYLIYSSLFAAVGAAVDVETDTQQFMLPITIPMMLAIFIAQTAVYNPDGPAVFWCSIIPFTSPVVMMIRIAMGNAFEHPGELALSMALLVATFLFTTWLAGRIYRTGILMYGKKVTWKELGKWLFYRG